MILITKSGIKGLLRNARDGGWRSAFGYVASHRVYSLLPSLYHTKPFEDFEIHVLTGRARLTMALCMIASWIVATGRCWRFVVHDDGTLPTGDAELLSNLLPNCRVLLSSETNPQVAHALNHHPLCLQCRNLHPLARKVIDMPLLASQAKLLSIDTDILFYRKPRRILNWMTETDSTCLFLEDVKDGCLLNPDQTVRLFGVKRDPRVNTGIVAVPKKIMSIDFLEECLDKANLLTRDCWYIEQTLYAIAASVYGRVELLPQEYFMALEPPCPEGAVARHYMGANRHLFYSEGLARLKRIMRNSSGSRNGDS
jgi:hypothetical protein